MLMLVVFTENRNIVKTQLLGLVSVRYSLCFFISIENHENFMCMLGFTFSVINAHVVSLIL